MEQEQDPNLDKNQDKNKNDNKGKDKSDKKAQTEPSTQASDPVDTGSKEENSPQQETKNSAAESLKRLAEELEQAKKDEAPTNQVRTEDAPVYNAPPRQEKPRQRATDEAPRPVKKFSWMAFFAFIISLGTASAVGFFWWQSQMWLKTQEQVEQLKKQSDANTLQSINQLQNRISTLQNQLQQQKATANKSTGSLASLTARVKELGQSQPNHWLASEALYLVNLAERRLLVEQDIKTAIELLLAADARLTAMQDPSVFHIRTAISEDIATLYGVKQPDSDAIYLSLSGLISQVQSLPFAHVYIPEPSKNSEQQEISADINDWQTNLKTSVSRFMGHFISVNHRERPVEPEIPADQQWYVRANLTTQLLMAQSSVLEQNNAIYQDALKQTQNWLQQYFDPSKPQVAAATVTINELLSRDVELSLPASLSSQALLSNQVKAQLNLKQGIEE